MRTHLTIGWRLPALEIPHLWAITAVVAVFVTSGLTGIWLGDFWWHLKVGEIIATTGQIPVADSFSFTVDGAPFVYQQWLAELYLYWLYRAGGLELVVLVNTLLITATTGLVLLACWEASGNLRIATATTIVGMFIALPNRDVRPQTLGFLFFALFYLLLSRYRCGAASPLWLLPLLAGVWGNVHGSVVVGFGLCALVFGAEVLKACVDGQKALPRRRLAALGIATAAIPLAMLLNPWGPGFFSYFLNIQRNAAIQTMVTEWFPPTIRRSEDIAFFVALLTCVAIFALSPKSMDITDVLLFVAFSALALQAVRNSTWLGIVAAPLAARQIAAILAASRPNRLAGLTKWAAPRPVARGEALANYGFVALLLGLAILALPWVKPSLPLPPRWKALIDPDTPVAATRFIANQFPDERFFHPDSYGSYLIWATPGKPRVFVDTRVELYPMSLWTDYSGVSLAQNWQERLAKYGIRHVLLPKRPVRGFQQPLLAELAASPDWQPLYEDEQAIVYGKRI